MKELSLHILDIVQNSVRAKAKHIDIQVAENIVENIFLFQIEDDGCGMDEEFVNDIKNPFTTTRRTRKVGLGIPFLNDTCILCNGELKINSKKDKGTMITATMEYNHIDRPPMGDMISTIVNLITSNPTIHFTYTHCVNSRSFTLDTDEIYTILEDVPIYDPKVRKWLYEYIRSELEEIQFKKTEERNKNN